MDEPPYCILLTEPPTLEETVADCAEPLYVTGVFVTLNICVALLTVSVKEVELILTHPVVEFLTEIFPV